jgi:hypothetical protein
MNNKLNTMKKYIIAILSLILIASCEEFLEEEPVGVLTQDFFETEQGMEDLVRGCYSYLRYRTGYEQCYLLWDFGVDEMTVSDQGDWIYYNTYGTQLNADQEYLYDLWSYNYRAINNCNTGIERIPLLKDPQGLMRTEEGRNARLGELRFLRAYYYFMLVQQFGAIPLSLKPVTGLQLEWPRRPVADVYEVIIADWTFAAHHLPETQTDYGRATANAARHYLAKAYLTRGSAVEDQRGQQPTDMDSAAYYADLCITSGYNTLVNNYLDIWDPDNQKNSEVVFATQFDTDAANISGSGVGYQNRTHLFWLQLYWDEPGVPRNIEYGRPYRRLMITDYGVDICDRLNDSRLRKSMLEVFFATETNQTKIPKWTSEELLFAFTNVAPDGAWAVKSPGDTIYADDYKFTAATPNPDDEARGGVYVGDTALVFLINDENTTLTDREIIAKGYTMYIRYFWRTDASRNPVELMNEDLAIGNMTIKTWTYGKEPSLYKFWDKERSGVNDEKGTRDVFNARLGETYLIAAEAYGRKGDYATAVERLNVLRRRAAYHDGEEKPMQWWQYDGGTQGITDGTEMNMEITASYWDADEPIENYPPSATSKESRFIHFMLNERCRELLGEMVRWEDLARTETLYERAYLFNPDLAEAGTMRPYHKLRPIPRRHIELIQVDGKPLTSEQRQAYQNPGY